MKEIYASMNKAAKHLEVLHDVFMDKSNFTGIKLDFNIYDENQEKLRKALDALSLENELYDREDRQMKLSDFLEYIFLGRGYYSIQGIEDRSSFISAILYFVNLLMCYESMTVSHKLRKKVLRQLGVQIPEVISEETYDELIEFRGEVGLPLDRAKRTPKLTRLNDYFDSILPKTAGGLWHELLVYIFLLRNDYGYIIPLLLSQRLIGTQRHIIPPDFLIIDHDKRIYGIEVGRKKEIQSGSFSLQTAIPTASIDTENSRNSDRCPECNRWIPFCDFVIQKYADLNYKIKKIEVKCLQECTIYSQKEVAAGKCPYTKYRRSKAVTLKHTHHSYADNKHYHYQCVLNSVSAAKKREIIKAQDNIALKTHYPYYSGLEELKRKEIISPTLENTVELE